MTTLNSCIQASQVEIKGFAGNCQMLIQEGETWGREYAFGAPKI